jgi:hypothetical protein
MKLTAMLKARAGPSDFGLERRRVATVDCHCSSVDPFQLIEERQRPLRALTHIALFRFEEHSDSAERLLAVCEAEFDVPLRRLDANCEISRGNCAKHRKGVARKLGPPDRKD